MKPGDRDTLVWMQNAEPLSLYCGDETDGETLALCDQVKEGSTAYEVGGPETVPRSRPSATPNEDSRPSGPASCVRASRSTMARPSMRPTS